MIHAGGRGNAPPKMVDSSRTEWENMNTKFLEAGQIINTHGVGGEVKISPWCDSAAFLCDFDTFYIDGKPVSVLAARVHKGFLLAKLEAVSDLDAANRLRGKVVSIDRSGVSLPDGRFFIADLIGLEVRSAETGQILGTLTDVMDLPGNEVYHVKGQKEYLIPAVKSFIAETNLEAGYMLVNLLEGMATDEN